MRVIRTFSVGGKDSVTPAGQRQAVLLSCLPLPVPLFLTAAALVFLLPRGGLGNRNVTLVLLVGSKGKLSLVWSMY